MESIVITGGAGYVGSHICKALHRAGYLPVVLDDLTEGHSSAVRWGPLEQGDLCDERFVRAVLKRYRPLGVVHCAALCNVSASIAQPERYYQTNVQGTLILLKAMQDCQISHLVFSSSCASYGNVQTSPISETHSQQPVTPYGWSKLIAERMIIDFGTAYGLKYALLRYFNAAGADKEGEIGESHSPETHLIPLVCAAALGKRTHLALFGEHYPTPDGTAIRDYIHVTDLAQAHVKALYQLIQAQSALILNLGSGRGTSVREVIRTAEKNINRTIPVKGEAARPGDPPILVADISLAKRLLDWTPEHSDIATIFQSAWNWACKNDLTSNN